MAFIRQGQVGGTDLGRPRGRFKAPTVTAPETSPASRLGARPEPPLRLQVAGCEAGGSWPLAFFRRPFRTALTTWPVCFTRPRCPGVARRFRGTGPQKLPGRPAVRDDFRPLTHSTSATVAVDRQLRFWRPAELRLRPSCGFRRVAQGIRRRPSKAEAKEGSSNPLVLSEPPKSRVWT